MILKCLSKGPDGRRDYLCKFHGIESRVGFIFSGPLGPEQAAQGIEPAHLDWLLGEGWDEGEVKRLTGTITATRIR